MNQIAICDNEKADLQLLDAQVREYLCAHAEATVTVVSFDSPVSLKGRLDAGERYCLYILDVLMPEIDGIEIGRLIRAADRRVPIIYTTSSEEYALGAYRNQAIRYLVKPVRRSELFSALDFGFSLFRRPDERIYTVKTRGGIVCIPGKDIVYAENKYRSVLYCLRGGEIVRSVSIRGTFEEAAAPLPDDPDFTRPHKSYFVNMRYIRSLQAGSLLLDDGREIPVSRNCSAQISRDYLDYLAREEGKTC